MSEIRDRIRGVLLRLAAGDRNGGPIRMAVRRAQSLADRRQFDPENILARYMAWWRDGAFDTGPTTAAAAFLPHDELAGCTFWEAGLTHHHPLAGDVAATVAVLSRAPNDRRTGDRLRG